jgi:tripartite-type tricarboxylate transporter receptor subunit TctC
VSTGKRSALLPDLPTIAEGGVPGYEATSWNGFAVRAGTPRAIIDRLQHETAEVLTVAEVREKMFGLGIEPVGSTPGEFTVHIRAERDKSIPLFMKIGIRPQ